MLYDGYKMSPDEGQEELEEVQAEIKSKDDDVCDCIRISLLWIMMELTLN